MSQRISRRKRRKIAAGRLTPPGASPGLLVTDPDAPQPAVRLIAYRPDEFVEKKMDDIQSIHDFLGKWPVTWINVDGLGNVETIRKIGELFGLHRLTLEDIVNTHQRAKLESYPDSLFIVGRMASLSDRLETEQLSLFLGRNYVLTFQETPGDCFDPVRTRIRTSGGRIRSAGPDYLAYALLDAVIDGYFPVLEHYGEELERVEDEIIARPEYSSFAQLHEAKRDLLTVRRAIWPQRETINSLTRDPIPLIADETRLYLRDCYDHTVEIIDLVETLRELCSDLADLYVSSVSNRLNEIMKVLTIIATIFIPLSFVASLYGMNFRTDKSPLNMPELEWYWGYPFALSIMAAIAFVLMWYFWRKGWLRSFESSSAGTRKSEDENEKRGISGQKP